MFFSIFSIKGSWSDMSKRFNIEVQSTGNIERALRQLKKKIEREGVVRDMKRQVYFEAPTQKRRKRMMRAIKNNIMRLASEQL
jgi:small subunit ribosomal protein S21